MFKLKLDQYIVCQVDCDLRYVEALSMIGLVTDVKTEECERKGFSRIVVQLFDGKFVRSKCYFEEEVKHSSKIIMFYMQLARQRGAVGKLEVVELPEESV